MFVFMMGCYCTACGVNVRDGVSLCDGVVLYSIGGILVNGMVCCVVTKTLYSIEC